MKIKFVLFAIVMLMLPTIALAEDILIDFKPVQGQPYWASNQINADSAEQNTLIITLSAKENGTARIFWANNYDPQFNQIKSLWFNIKSGEHTYYFNVASQNQCWIGWTKGFALIPEMDPSSVSIQQAKLISATFLTNLLSGWQEFWGPYGRNIVGYTINTMPSPTLLGSPIYVYLYWLICVLSAYFVALSIFDWLFSKKKQRASFSLVIYRIFCVILGFWIMLEVSNLVTYWNNAKDGFSLLGKSIDQKLTVVNTNDFYPFIQFCRQYLPPNVDFDYRIPPLYNDIKAVYYLYPHEYKKGSNFVIVYNSQPEEELTNNYIKWKSFSSQAYILKKR